MGIVTIENLQKTFADLTAVNGVSFTVEQGEVHGILGPNGAGKSTTINCMTGLLPYDGGKISFENGQSIAKWKRNIGYVPQDLAIYPDLSAKENVRFFCSLYGYKGSELKEKVEAALDFVGLLEVKRKKASEYSGGMKRRLNMACGIVHSPKLIIMDEPTVGIDPQSRNRILENVHALNENGATIIYTTHYMPEVEEICNKITVIDHGKVVAGGTKAEIIEKMGKDLELDVEFSEKDENLEGFENAIRNIYGVHRSTVTVEEEKKVCKIFYAEEVKVLEDVIRLAADAGLTITNIRNLEPSLEEIFLTLTGKELRDGE
ncbi:MAG: ABC transporter ATP-binding protein [Lachnospiraceae bacterium]|nr:ABC transporter ATP-binding protein [Lachnospiraceae bacterium]